ncbi:MarR family transcriptional regulator [Paractinoplanes ferrugineus]|uniref:MarR family transcriptional regulator n=1 Tax=Paractinoplanes ferrugineus TaxID=113564 RepID=A0A919MGK7_9ACTN|nr:MarR family transcriptional regulator [Actinoplanes ferrugineus]GIE14913.1 MarR family transcriptional regulator [Actinoplanes ferrugineus]
MGDDGVLGRIETQVALLMRLGEATRRSTGVQPHRALDRAAYVILRRLEQDGPLNVSVLAAALNLDGSTVTRQVTALQKDGLAERGPDPKDGRGTVIAATPLGLTEVERVRQARKMLYGKILAGYSDQERQDLAATLEKFTGALAEHMRTRV